MQCKLCNKAVKAKGLCSAHYTQYLRKQIDIKGKILKRPVCRVYDCANDHTASNGLCWLHYRQKLKGIELHYKGELPAFNERIKIPVGWGNFSAERKRIHILATSDVNELKAISEQDQDIDIRLLAQKALQSDWGISVIIPEKLICKFPGCKKTPDKHKFLMGYCVTHYYKVKENAKYEKNGCKIKDCKGEPQYKGYPHGFCILHYDRYKRGMIDYDGRDIEIRNLSTKTHFNTLVINTVKLYYEVQNALMQMSKKDPLIFNFTNLQVGLAFIKSPNFILTNAENLTNSAIRTLINNEGDRKALKGFIDEAKE